jgi:hypothetical protein
MGVNELIEESRLPHSGLPDHGHELLSLAKNPAGTPK